LCFFLLLVSVVVSVVLVSGVAGRVALASGGADGVGAGDMSGLVGVGGDAMPGWVEPGAGAAGGAAVCALATAASAARVEPAIIRRIIRSLLNVGASDRMRIAGSWLIN
jgi:hypothetical protein